MARRNIERSGQSRFVFDEKDRLKLPNNSGFDTLPPIKEQKPEVVSYLFAPGKKIWMYSKQAKKIAVTVFQASLVARATGTVDQQGRRKFQVSYPATIKWPSGKVWQLHSGDVFWAKPSDAERQLNYQPPQPDR